MDLIILRLAYLDPNNQACTYTMVLLFFFFAVFYVVVIVEGRHVSDSYSSKEPVNLVFCSNSALNIQSAVVNSGHLICVIVPCILGRGAHLM